MLEINETLQSAFNDELEKIAGEMHGFTRSGRKPIGVDRLLERESESETTPSNAFSSASVPSEAFKADVEKVSSLGAGVALGALGTLALSRMNRDRKLGRQMRLQQEASQG